MTRRRRLYRFALRTVHGLAVDLCYHLDGLWLRECLRPIADSEPEPKGVDSLRHDDSKPETWN